VRAGFAWLIARRELAALARAPSSWIALALASPAAGVAFLSSQRSLRARPAWMVLEDLFALSAALAALAGLLLGARALVDERLSGSWVALAAAPVSDIETIAGKWFAATAAATATAMACSAPWLALVAADAGSTSASAAHSMGALVGIALGAGTSAAIGLAAGALVRAPAAVLASAGCVSLALLLAGRVSRSVAAPAEHAVGWLSAELHALAFAQGEPGVSDVAYFFGLSYMALTASVVGLRRSRWG